MSASEYCSERQTMLSIVLLGLMVCGNASSFKFRRVNKNHDRELENSQRDHKIYILNRQKGTIINREENLNNEIMNINRRQDELNKQIEHIMKQKETLQKQADFLFRQKNQLHREMEKLYATIERINGNQRNYISAIVEGNEYKITLYLSGYSEEDIVVKSKKGLLIVQADHNVPGEPKSNYLNVIDLPDFVEGSGRWLYVLGVLKIAFPIIQRQNKYSKLTTPLGNEEVRKAENIKTNIIEQNPANNLLKRSSDNSDTTKMKGTGIPTQGNGTITREHGEEGNIYGFNIGTLDETIYAVPGNNDNNFIL